MGDDLDRLRAALAEVEDAASALPWAHERPWTAPSHVWMEGAIPCVDLHDLNVKCAKRALRAAFAVAPTLDAAAVLFITGRGRRSIGPGVLGQVARGLLAGVAAANGWSWQPRGGARALLVIDPARAPAAATGRLSWWFWLGVLGFFALLAYSVIKG